MKVPAPRVTGEMLSYARPVLLAPRPVERERFVAAMGLAVGSVSVVTTSGAAGRHGITVSAVTSVSADPPLLLVCINRNNPAGAAVKRNRVFCVNYLHESQESVARVFGGQAPPPGDGRFGCADWTRLETGAPVLVGAIGAFDCRIEQQHDMGSHTVFIGAVLGVALGDGLPLVYGQRRYGVPDFSRG